MNSFKEKAQVFIVGLSFGLLIAGAFFILKLDDYFKELSVYKKMAQTFTMSKPVDKSTEAQPLQIKKNDAPVLRPKPIVIYDTVKHSLDNSPMSSRTDSVLHTDSLNSEEIVVRKDELLATKTLEVNNLNPVASRNAKDSVLQKVSGIKDDKLSGKQMFNIELWSSPLNYKGYKLSKYKMVLYGINNFDGMKLYKLDDIIYLKVNSAIYKLDYASDFKPYEHITDEQIINKLK